MILTSMPYSPACNALQLCYPPSCVSWAMKWAPQRMVFRSLLTRRSLDLQVSCMSPDPWKFAIWKAESRNLSSYPQWTKDSIRLWIYSLIPRFPVRTGLRS